MKELALAVVAYMLYQTFQKAPESAPLIDGNTGTASQVMTTGTGNSGNSGGGNNTGSNAGGYGGGTILYQPVTVYQVASDGRITSDTVMMPTRIGAEYMRTL